MLLKRLTEAVGLPGYENSVRDMIIGELRPYADRITVDRLGNVTAVKNEGKPGRKRVALAAHMDEAGLIVTGIDKEGLLHVGPWGVEARVLVAKTVKVGPGQIPGVIGSKPLHLQKKEERDQNFPLESLFVDIGCKTKEEAEKLVSAGDYVAFDSDYKEFGDHKVKAKALDDRVGCAAIIEIFRGDYPHELTGIFNAQEEVGTRGSVVTANTVHVDLIINIEATFSLDVADVEPRQVVTELGKGPALYLADRGSLYQRKYVEEVLRVARENGIPCQLRQSGAGGTDAVNYHTAHGGTPVIGLAVPCRYIHSPVSVMDMRDYENLLRLIEAYLNKEA